MFPGDQGASHGTGVRVHRPMLSAVAPMYQVITLLLQVSSYNSELSPPVGCEAEISNIECRMLMERFIIIIIFNVENRVQHFVK